MTRDHAAIYRRRVERAGGRLDRSADNARRRARTARRHTTMASMLAETITFAKARADEQTDPTAATEWRAFAAWLRDRRAEHLTRLQKGHDR